VSCTCPHSVSSYITGWVRIGGDAGPEELYAAIRAVAADRACYDANTARHVLIRVDDEVRYRAPMSRRELEVAALIAEGSSNKEISFSLQISEATVKKHVGGVIRKLRLADRLQVGVFLVRHPQVLAR
jgi:two-component system, NarL family, response regulator LiaR